MNRSGSSSDIINTHLPDRKKSGIFCYRKYLRILRRVGLFIFRVSDFDFATDRCSTRLTGYDIIISVRREIRHEIVSQNQNKPEICLLRVPVFFGCDRKEDEKCLIL